MTLTNLLESLAGLSINMLYQPRSWLCKDVDHPPSGESISSRACMAALWRSQWCCSARVSADEAHCCLGGLRRKQLCPSPTSEPVMWRHGRPTHATTPLGACCGPENHRHWNSAGLERLCWWLYVTQLPMRTLPSSACRHSKTRGVTGG